MLWCCFGDSTERYADLSRDELKAWYEKSVTVNNGRLIVHGLFARANCKNNNGRIYPKNVLHREVTKYINSHIKQGTALGELDHPSYHSRFFKCLNLPNISHQVLEVHWVNDSLYGMIEVLPTPSGLLLWELYSQGIKLGVSSRGWASLRTDPEKKLVFVDDDYELITFDFVTEPSTRGAFLLPLPRQYRRRVPDQSKYVRVAHLGYGVVNMRKLQDVPDAKLLRVRIQQLRSFSEVQQSAPQLHYQPPAAGWHLSSGDLMPQAGKGTAGPITQGTVGKAINESHQEEGLRAPPPALPPVASNVLPPMHHPLDHLLLYGHYIVHQDDPNIQKESHVRYLPQHFTNFQSRAYVASLSPSELAAHGGPPPLQAVQGLQERSEAALKDASMSFTNPLFRKSAPANATARPPADTGSAVTPVAVAAVVLPGPTAPSRPASTHSEKPSSARQISFEPSSGLTHVRVAAG